MSHASFDRTSAGWLSPSRALAALALAASLAACSPDSPTEPAPVPVATVAVVASVNSLAVGTSTALSATPKSAAGEPLSARVIAWSTTNNSIATVSASGLVSAISPGIVRIRATSENVVGEVELTVLPRSSLVASVRLDAESVVLTAGETRQLNALPFDAQGSPVTGVDLTWTLTGDIGAATVSSTGLLTAHDAGISTVSARVGDRSAQAIVTVLGTSSYDLVFDRWEVDAAGIMRPWLHRLDMRIPRAEPVGIFPIANTWDAAPAPDGSRIAFTCVTDAGTGICVANRDGSGATLIPGFGELNGLRADKPAWSPDGTRIAFRGWATGGDVGIFNPGDIWAMNADGSNKLRLTAGVRNETSYDAPAWSPRLADGSYRIAFARTSRGADGYVRANLESIRSDGGAPQIITQAGPYVDSDPTWSPDASAIAFVRTGGAVGGDIWAVNATGGNERSLMPVAVDPPGTQRSPVWSTDGALIAFASNHEIIATYAAWQIYTVRADGTNIVRRTSDRSEKGNPAWLKR